MIRYSSFSSLRAQQPISRFMEETSTWLTNGYLDGKPKPGGCGWGKETDLPIKQVSLVRPEANGFQIF